MQVPNWILMINMYQNGINNFSKIDKYFQLHI